MPETVTDDIPTVLTRCSRCMYDYMPGPGGVCPRCLAREVAGEEVNRTEAYDEAASALAEELRAVAEGLEGIELLDELGRGGMGVVFRARQTRLGRTVAVKMLAGERVDRPELVARFEQEGRAMAALSHPGIVAIHDVGVVSGHPYLVMEYVDGCSLRELLLGGVTPEQALQLVPELCAAVDYAHAAGVIHRDLKPENILITRSGQPKIADFGLARLGQPRTAGLTRTGAVMGTPNYMAPEQWEAPGLVDARADVYALGVILYELLTGQLPLGRFAPPSDAGEVGAGLDEVVLRALDARPEQRYASARELSAAIAAGVEAGLGASRIAPPHPVAPAASQRRVRAELLARPHGRVLIRLVVDGSSRVLEHRLVWSWLGDSTEQVLLDDVLIAEGPPGRKAYMLRFELPARGAPLACELDTHISWIGHTSRLRLRVQGEQVLTMGRWPGDPRSVAAPAGGPAAPRPPLAPEHRRTALALLLGAAATAVAMIGCSLPWGSGLAIGQSHLLPRSGSAYELSLPAGTEWPLQLVPIGVLLAAALGLLALFRRQRPLPLAAAAAAFAAALAACWAGFAGEVTPGAGMAIGGATLLAVAVRPGRPQRALGPGLGAGCVRVASVVLPLLGLALCALELLSIQGLAVEMLGFRMLGHSRELSAVAGGLALTLVASAAAWRLRESRLLLLSGALSAAVVCGLQLALAHQLAARMMEPLLRARVLGLSLGLAAAAGITVALLAARAWPGRADQTEAASAQPRGGSAASAV